MPVVDIWTRWHNLPPWMREKEREFTDGRSTTDPIDSSADLKFQPSYFVLFVMTANCRKRATRESERDRYIQRTYICAVSIETKRSSKRSGNRVGDGITIRENRMEHLASDVTLGDTCAAAAARVKINCTGFSRTADDGDGPGSYKSTQVDMRRFFRPCRTSSRILTWRDARRWTISY